MKNLKLNQETEITYNEAKELVSGTMAEIEQLFEQIKQNQLDVKRFCKLSQDDRDKLYQLWIAYLINK